MREDTFPVHLRGEPSAFPCPYRPLFIQHAFIEHQPHTKPVLGAGATGESKTECSLPCAAHGWGWRPGGRL